MGNWIYWKHKLWVRGCNYNNYLHNTAQTGYNIKYRILN